MDARSMTFDDGEFDVVIDKGMLDAIVCGNPSVSKAQEMLSEIHRVLKKDGTYVCISREVGKMRKKYLKNTKKFNWKVKKTPLPKPIYGTQPTRAPKVPEKDDKKNWHFLYTCAKQATPVIDTDDEKKVTDEKM